MPDIKRASRLGQGAAWLLLALALAACAAPAVPTPAPGEGATPAPAEPTAPLRASSAAPQADPAGPPPDPDEVAIYAAVIRQLYRVDHTFGDSPPDWPLIIVLSVTDDSVSGQPDAEAAPRALPPALQQAISGALADLPAEVRWVAGWESVAVDADGMIEGGAGVLITLGNIHLREDGAAEVPASLYCGGLCGTGTTYVLERVGGAWQVTGTTGLGWIS